LYNDREANYNNLSAPKAKFSSRQKKEMDFCAAPKYYY